MKFMVELRLSNGAKNQALDLFEARGPSRSPGVTLRGAWVAAKEDRVYALVEGADATLVADAVKAWGQQGESQITPVLDIDQF